MVNLRLITNFDHVEHAQPKNNDQIISALSTYAPHISKAQQPEKTRYFSLFTIVAIIHAVGLLWVLYSAQIEHVALPEPAPMMVSLVENPAPEPEVVPLLPTQPAPVIKPQKPIVKNVEKPQPVVEEVVSQPTQAAPIVAEVPIVATIAPPKITEAPTIEPEPMIEPPKFGVAYLKNPAPSYPSISRRMGEQGRALLRVLVSESGDAATVQIDTSSGSERLDLAAVQAVKEWRFVPAKRNKQNISAFVLVPIKFSLEN